MSRKSGVHKYETGVVQMDLIPQVVQDGKKKRVNLPVAGSETEQKPQSQTTEETPREKDSCWDWVR